MGYLANELISGKLQVGDNTFQQMPPATIPIAGDPDNAGPTYAQLGTSAASLLANTPAKIGDPITVIVAADGTVTDGGGFAGISLSPKISAYDSATQHNVLGFFADYRTKVGLASIGLAKSEPFRLTVKVAGTPQSLIAQVFERRVLTYTSANPDPFKVEMGNIGQHYYKWRYPTGLPLTVPTTTPTTTTPTASDPGQAALSALPAGYTVKSVQTVDLGVDGQQQAIVVAENPAAHGQIAALIVQKNGAWAIAFRTKPDDNATAMIAAYPKTSAHPGFVAVSYHLCGANCNDGEHTIIRWDGGGATTVILNGNDDRGALSADLASGKVTLRGPLYRTQDPNCCATFSYTRSWTWQGGGLAPGQFDFAAAGEANQAVPQWLKTNGAALILFLSPFLAAPVDLTGPLASAFSDPIVVTDLQGATCSAPATAFAKGLTSITIPYIGGLWPVDTGGFRATIDLNTSRGATPSAQAGNCALGGPGIGGYILTITTTGSAPQIIAAQAVAQVFKAIPDTAIQVPPT